MTGNVAWGRVILAYLNKSKAGHYGFAVLAVGLGGVATLLIPTFGADRPFLLFLFGAVVASSWLGGIWPGWLAVVLSTLFIDFFYIPPLYAITGNIDDLPWLLAFVICSLIGNVLGSRYRQMERELADVRERLRKWEHHDTII